MKVVSRDALLWREATVPPAGQSHHRPCKETVRWGWWRRQQP